MKPDLAKRRARIARVNAKRPRDIAVEVYRVRDDAARDRLLDVLFDLLEPVITSGRK